MILNFDSLLVFLLKNGMSELYDHLAHEKLTMKSLVKVRQNDDVLLGTDIDENVITVCYYYGYESFDHKKELIFLKKFFEGG